MTYRYSVGDREFTGQRFTYDDAYRRDAGVWAQGYVNTARPGQEVTVYYDPKDPADSVLKLWEDPTEWVMLLAVLPFFSIELLLFWLIPQRIFRGDELKKDTSRTARRSDSTFDGIEGWGRFSRHTGSLSIRKPAIRWKRALFMFTVVPPAVGVPVMAYVANARNWVLSGQGAAAAWWVTLGLLGLGILHQLADRGPLLILDLANCRVLVKGRRRLEQFDFRDIAAWSLEWMPSPTLWGSATSQRALLLSLCRHGGETIPLHVFPADGRAQAEKALNGFAGATQSKAMGLHSERLKAEKETPDNPAKARARSPLAGLRFPDVGAWLKYGDLC